MCKPLNANKYHVVCSLAGEVSIWAVVHDRLAITGTPTLQQTVGLRAHRHQLNGYLA